jgi:deazaflavin-dependent oxidoreductase (nitroreductase family)
MAVALLGKRLAAADVCDLETMGRVSRVPREVEIWFAATGDRVYLLSGGRDSAHWVRNIAATPEVRITIDGRRFRGSARVIEGESDDRLARELLAAKYEGWSKGRRLSQWARESLPVAIDLQAEEVPR